jgi:maltose O-acetyltransferase
MSMLRKFRNVAQSEVSQLHPRLWLARLLLSPLPIYVGSRLRTEVLRRAGFRIGSGSMFFGMPILTGIGNIYERLVIGKECLVSWGCYLDLQAPVHVGDRVGFSPQISVLTSSHEVGSPYNRVGQLHALPVTIQDGVWLGARCTIMPGVTIHRGAVVAAGAVVTKDVPADMVVGGVPARVLRELSGPESENGRVGIKHTGPITIEKVNQTAS